MVQLLTTHKGQNMAVSIITAGSRLIVGFSETVNEHNTMIVDRNSKGEFAPFGIRMLNGREAMVHVKGGKIQIRNANKNIEVVKS
jgi:hypothetical protein